MVREKGPRPYPSTPIFLSCFLELRQEEDTKDHILGTCNVPGTVRRLYKPSDDPGGYVLLNPLAQCLSLGQSFVE